jgi:hypothetical protein
MKMGSLIGGIVLIIVGAAISLLGLAICAGTIITRMENTSQLTLASDMVIAVMGLVIIAIGIASIVVGSVLLYRRKQPLTMRPSQLPLTSAAGSNSPGDDNVRRPKGIYFVAGWFFFVWSFQITVLGSLSQAYQAQEAPTPPWLGTLVFAALFLQIYLTVGLIQLRPGPRWFFVGLLGMVTLTGPLKLFASGFRFLPHFLVLTAINGVVVWYLCRPSFIAVCRQFRKKCDQEKMEKYAAKQMAKLRGKKIP